jgi:hypothetical protein
MYIRFLWVRYSLFTLLDGWHASAFSLPPVDDIFAQLTCPSNDAISFFALIIANLSFYKHWKVPFLHMHLLIIVYIMNI